MSMGWGSFRAPPWPKRQGWHVYRPPQSREASAIPSEGLLPAQGELPGSPPAPRQADVVGYRCGPRGCWGAAAFASHRLPCSPRQQRPWAWGSQPAWVHAVRELGFPINSVSLQGPGTQRPHLPSRGTFPGKGAVRKNSKVLLPGLGLREPSGPALNLYPYRLLPWASVSPLSITHKMPLAAYGLDLTSPDLFFSCITIFFFINAKLLN